MANMEMMIATLKMPTNPQNSIRIQNQLVRFMVDEGDANFNELLRKALILKQKKSRCILESVFKLVLCTTEFDKALFKKSHLQTQSRIVDQYRKFGTTGYRRRK
jgi:predicted ABC-class ATPase